MSQFRLYFEFRIGGGNFVFVYFHYSQQVQNRERPAEESRGLEEHYAERYSLNVDSMVRMRGNCSGSSGHREARIRSASVSIKSETKRVPSLVRVAGVESCRASRPASAAPASSRS